MKIYLSFIRTCHACPEQYDVFYGDIRVGYVRFRHGNFTVDCPDAFDENVLKIKVDSGSGIFSDEERTEYLQKAADSILHWMVKNSVVSPLPENVEVCFNVENETEWNDNYNGTF